MSTRTVALRSRSMQVEQPRRPDPSLDPPPTTAPTPYTAVPRLPDTGRNAGMIVGWGMSVLLSGVAFLAGGRACRNRKDLK